MQVNPTADQMLLLDRIIDEVKNSLKSINVSVPFFIAGGSIFSTLQDKDIFVFDNTNVQSIDNIIDLDVWFYNDVDFNEVDEALQSDKAPFRTNNAITIDYNDNKIQYIKTMFGNMSDVVNSFDINCSKVAYSSDRKFYCSNDFSTNIKTYNEKITYQSYYRYIKYVNAKDAVDNNYDELKKLIDYYVLNWNTKLANFYEGNKSKTGADVLRRIFNSDIHSKEIRLSVHDKIVEHIKTIDRIDIFKGYYLISEPESLCDEYLLNCILAFDKNERELYTINDSTLVRIKSRYPEYFI